MVNPDKRVGYDPFSWYNTITSPAKIPEGYEPFTLDATSSGVAAVPVKSILKDWGLLLALAIFDVKAAALRVKLIDDVSLTFA